MSSLIEASPDGRYLAYADVTGDPKTIEAVVVDFATGKEIVRSSDGFTTSDDQANAYEDVEPGLIAVDDKTAWFRTLDGDLGYDLRTGDRVEVPTGTEPWRPHGIDGYHLWNPSHTWQAVGKQDQPGRLVGPDGAELKPPAGGTVMMAGRSESGGATWFNDAIRVGRLERASGVSLMACDVGTRTCAAVPGTEAPQARPLGWYSAGDGDVPILLPESHLR